MEQDSEGSISKPGGDETRCRVVTPAQGDVAGAPPTSETPCPTCAGAAASMPVSYVYAIGRIEARFPRLSVEKEFAQATGRAETAGQTDQQAFHDVLSKPENRYLARQLCWVLTIQGLETYILHPRDPRDLDRLVEAIRPRPSPMDIDCRHRPAGADRSAGALQRADGPDRRLRPDLLVRPRCAHQGHPAAGEDEGRPVRSGGGRSVRSGSCR